MSEIQEYVGDHVKAKYHNKILVNVFFEVGLVREMVPFPNFITSKHFRNGQATIHGNCMQCCMVLFYVNPLESIAKEHRLPFFLRSDLLFNVTKCLVKPAKQPVTGSGMKSIIGNEKVCKILHKFGHFMSCSDEQGIRAEIGVIVMKRHKATPDGLYRESILARSVAWDNYDDLPASSTADQQATHDCMDVLYQNKRPGRTCRNRWQDTGPISKQKQASYAN